MGGMDAPLTPHNRKNHKKMRFPYLGCPNKSKKLIIVQKNYLIQVPLLNV